ncbi:hypothetical protein N9P99_01565 [Planktomarina temperata]|nr:hypothetical protein [Planktomarina temperata]
MNLIEEIGDHYQRALNTVGGSGIDWVDKVFKICVIFLVDLADFDAVMLRPSVQTVYGNIN